MADIIRITFNITIIFGAISIIFVRKLSRQNIINNTYGGFPNKINE